MGNNNNQSGVPYSVAFNPILLPVGTFSYAYYLQLKFEVTEAIRKLISGGAVAEYHVGSRGLKRYTLGELQDLLKFWSNMADDALNGGSAIKAKRGVPCDV